MLLCEVWLYIYVQLLDFVALCRQSNVTGWIVVVCVTVGLRGVVLSIQCYCVKCGCMCNCWTLCGFIVQDIINVQKL